MRLRVGTIKVAEMVSGPEKENVGLGRGCIKTVGLRPQEAPPRHPPCPGDRTEAGAEDGGVVHGGVRVHGDGEGPRDIDAVLANPPALPPLSGPVGGGGPVPGRPARLVGGGQRVELTPRRCSRWTCGGQGGGGEGWRGRAGRCRGCASTAGAARTPPPLGSQGDPRPVVHVMEFTGWAGSRDRQGSDGAGQGRAGQQRWVREVTGSRDLQDRAGQANSNRSWAGTRPAIGLGLFHGKRKRHRGGFRRRQGAPVLGVPSLGGKRWVRRRR
ncbi:hypothetical protein BHE74_00049861 [Ensete ventricosum]|uniref:Uncharacterized protein n=1 Tax=Ensete ventricosum TaxID=4639 RepID=A0A444C4F5_ENSVE|nr:hypothetical protein GW17_00058019 [Ensete ventricosum]RWW44379.1 hypothetical protein BHE74_00049861 [Ensete ventricosum]RZR74903.1 hypothetical protein BHM03_00045880 [Ensete ventricosum]